MVRELTFVKNTDGSIIVYFTPTAPAGHDANWMYTAASKGWFGRVLLYSSDKPRFNET